MKITRLHAFTCVFGRLEFEPTTAPDGWKVHWRKAGQDQFRRIDWNTLTTDPILALARFYIRVAVAEDRGLPRYTYADQNKDPDEP